MSPRRPARSSAATAPNVTASAAGIPADRNPQTHRSRFSRAAWLGEILRQRILDGTYLPGTPIREADLQSEFGFSNGPTREALQLVVASGLAERAPWQSVRVVELNESEIVEIFQLRAALLEYAADLAARVAPAEVLAQAAALKRNLRAEFERVRSQQSHPSFSGSLSAWLLAAAGNATLKRAWERDVVRAQIYVNTSMRKDAGAKSGKWIERLIDAVVDRDQALAREAARNLTRQTLEDLDIRGTI
jgi:DNA-binding GntR family transcriptional regulator